MNVLEATTAISFKNILFLTDFTEASQPAFSYAVAIARHHDARLYPAHAIVPFMPTELEAPVMPELLTQVETQKRSQLVEMVRELGLSYLALVTQGTVEDAVPRWINEHGIDLIVMDTHARKGLDRFLLGSTAEAIFRTATCPVLTVGPNVNPRIFDGLKISKVLYATALTRQAEAAATYALSFAQERSARLTVLHVLPEETETGVDSKRLASFARGKLEKLAPPETGVAFQPEFIVDEGDPAKQILKYAAKTGADLIVLGLSSVTKPTTHFQRGVAYRVISKAPCAVLTVR